MFRDDCPEYNKGTLQVKMSDIPAFNAKGGTQKPRRTTKYDFSGNNYETCTLGHVACLEEMSEEDRELIEEICKQAREVAGVRKLLAPCEHDKYSTLQTDPEFLARALLFKSQKGKKNNNATYKDTNEESGVQDGDDDEANGGNNCEGDDSDLIDDNANANSNDLPDELGDSNIGESESDEGENGNDTDNGSQVETDSDEFASGGDE